MMFDTLFSSFFDYEIVITRDVLETNDLSEIQSDLMSAKIRRVIIEIFFELIRHAYSIWSKMYESIEWNKCWRNYK